MPNSTDPQENPEKTSARTRTLMNQPSTAGSQPPARTDRRREIGIVTSDRMMKTRRVVVERLVPHPKYGKLLRRRTICHAHDEANASHVGDLVEIMSTRPL